MKKYLTEAILILSVSPLSVFATAGVTDFSGLGQFINDIKDNVIVNLSALFLTAAVVAFFYGVVNYIISIRNGETKGVADGKQFMLWGLIALFVMFSVWGIVTFAQKTLGIEGKTQIDIPSIRFQDTGAASAGNNAVSPAGGAWVDNTGTPAGGTWGQTAAGIVQNANGGSGTVDVTGVGSVAYAQQTCVSGGGLWVSGACEMPGSAAYAEQTCINGLNNWVNGTCVTGSLLKSGAACTADSQCSSNNCVPQNDGSGLNLCQ